MQPNLPPVVVSEEVKLISAQTGMSFSEVYDEVDRLWEEAAYESVQPLMDELIRVAVEKYTLAHA